MYYTYAALVVAWFAAAIARAASVKQDWRDWWLYSQGVIVGTILGLAVLR